MCGIETNILMIFLVLKPQVKLKRSWVSSSYDARTPQTDRRRHLGPLGHPPSDAGLARAPRLNALLYQTRSKRHGLGHLETNGGCTTLHTRHK